MAGPNLRPGMNIGPYQLIRRVSGKKWRVRHRASGRLKRISEASLLGRMTADVARKLILGIPRTLLVDNGRDFMTETTVDVLRNLGIHKRKGE